VDEKGDDDISGPIIFRLFMTRRYGYMMMGWLGHGPTGMPVGPWRQTVAQGEGKEMSEKRQSRNSENGQSRNKH
jgi:hypothetical protein